MTIWERFWWYMSNIVDYTTQMLPCMAAALSVFVLIQPARKKRLSGKGLSSGPWREAALLLFSMYCAGLAALTLFPANFWTHILRWITSFGRIKFDLPTLYPGWDEIWAETDYRNLFTPFQEIRRGLQGGPWVFFMLLGNIGIFLPMGFLPALLWRSVRWWQVMLLGFFTSGAIECIQFFIGRSTDIDDIILNTAGTVLGFFIFRGLDLCIHPSLSRFYCYERKDTTHGSSD